MFLVYGVALFVVAALLTAAAGMIFQRGTASRGVRRAIACPATCATLASTMGIGAVFLIAFLTEFESQGEILLQVILAVVLVVAGCGGIRFIARRTPPEAAHHTAPRGGMRNRAA